AKPKCRKAGSGQRRTGTSIRLPNSTEKVSELVAVPGIVRYKTGRVQVFSCRSAPRPTRCRPAEGDPKTGGLAGTARIAATFIDAASNTLIFAEGYGTCGPGGGSLWANIDLSNEKPYSYLPAMCVSAANGMSAPKGIPGQLYRTDGDGSARPAS